MALDGNIRMLTRSRAQQCSPDTVQWWTGWDYIYDAGSNLRRIFYLPLWVIVHLVPGYTHGLTTLKLWRKWRAWRLQRRAHPYSL